MRAVALAAAGLVVLAIADLGLAQAPVPIIPIVSFSLAEPFEA